MSTRLLAVTALASLCGAGCREATNEYVAPPPPTVTVARPESRSVVDHWEYTGRLSAVAEANLVARVPGYLKSIHFEDGAHVEAGQLLFTIDSAEYEVSLRSAEASVAEAQAALKLATATLERRKKAAQSNAVSELDVLEAEAQELGAQARLLSAESAREQAQLNLDWTEVRAPMAGRIQRALVDPGNLVGSGSNTLLARLIQLDPIFADFDMNERDLLVMRARRIAENKLKPGEDDRLEQLHQVQLELGLTNEVGYPHTGKVHFADSEVDPGTGTLLIRGRFLNPSPHVLVPGAFVRVRAPLDARQVLLVPERALGTNQSGSYLMVVEAGDVVQPRPVRLGTRFDDLVVVEEGLSPDDRVVIEGLLRARPGSKVTPRAASAVGTAPAATQG